MTVPETIVDLSDSTIVPRIENLTISCQDVLIESAPGAPELPGGCPTIKYTGDTVTLQATPASGIGPYVVTFKKNGVTIGSPRLGGLSNPITGAPEDIQITRIYTLDDLDISSASTGDITFSVEISDSCPTGSNTCTSECVIPVGCHAPVCSFVVT